MCDRNVTGGGVFLKIGQNNIIYFSTTFHYCYISTFFFYFALGAAGQNVYTDIA